MPVYSRQATITNQTGASVNATPQIVVYPNPVTDGILRVGFLMQQPGTYSMQLSNELGQEVLKRTILLNSKNQEITVPLDAKIPKGLYALIITGNNGVVTTRQVMVQ